MRKNPLTAFPVRVSLEHWGRAAEGACGMRKHGGMTIAIRGCRIGVLLALLAPFASLPARSAHSEAATTGLLGDSGSSGQILFLAVLVGTVGFAVLSAIALMRARNRAELE